ncbi:MAG: DUF3015 family protein [Nitrospiraceae bacterium]
MTPTTRTARVTTRVSLVGFALLSLPSTGCTVKATLNSTTNTTNNFLSSTSGRSWLTEDGLVVDELKTQVFVVANRDNLQQDIARADGEYLSSFEGLLGVPAPQRAAFIRDAQAHQHLLGGDGPSLVAFATTMSASAEALRASVTNPSH